jgi:hypothetical protein
MRADNNDAMQDTNNESKSVGSDNIHSTSSTSSIDARLPLTTESTVPPMSSELSPEQWATAEELSRLDPQLAGLYRVGIDLLQHAQEQGIAYMLAHAGRELSRGVIRLLAGADVALSEDSTAELPDNERNRAAICTILQLPPGHPLVTKWFTIHTTLVRSVHFRQPGPIAEDVRDAFLQLSDLLFGRIGPYFATHAQLDAFLQIESPDGALVERARAMLARLVQRQYFFTNLAHSGWLAPLSAAGQFTDPPEIIDLGDGSWRLQPWPEGEYLIRMGALAPETVTDLILRIPKKLKNPVVWDAVARAAMILPTEFAERLTGHLESALKTPLPNWFSGHVTPVVRKLAEGRRDGAFRLAACLLWLSNTPIASGQDTDSSNFMLGQGTEWILRRLDSYTLGEFLKGAVPALTAFKPHETVALLSKTLDRATWLVEKAEGAPANYQRGSISWCPRLDDAEAENDVRAQLAIALTGVATHTALISEEDAARVLDIIKKYKHEIFQRIRIAVLTSAGQLTQKHLDEIIINPQLLDSPPSRREYATLLRSQFNNASPRAQRIFVYALGRGPEPDKVEDSLTGWAIEPSEEGVRAIVIDWQRQKLQWFHDQIPELLLPMANRLGVKPRKPDEKERALNEEGFYSVGVRYMGNPSPVSVEELFSMTPDALVTYLETWRPDTTLSREGPTISGLEQTLSLYTAEHPESAGDVADRLIAASVSPGYINALLGGFTKALEKDQKIPWSNALKLTAFTVRRADEVEREDEGNNLARYWRWAASTAAQLIEKGCAGNHMPASEADAVWRILDDACRSEATWAKGDVGEDFKTLYSIISAALNTPSGHFVEALIDVGLWEYRRAYPGEDGEQIRGSSVVAPRLVPLLEELLGRSGRAGLAAQAMLGHYIPQVLLMAREWTLESAERLFDGGAASPTTRPVWGAYITRSGLYDNVFRDLRSWYAVAANIIGKTDEGVNPQDSQWSTSRHLAIHVLRAVLRGLAAVGDSDNLVERTFSNVSVTDRSHTYWNIFRGWSDNGSPVDQEYVARLVKFWEWRLDQLEASEDVDTRTKEAAGLRWLLATPYITTADALRLGRRTMDLSGDVLEARGASLWARLTELAEADANETYEIVERLIHKILVREYPYLPFERVSPPLRHALNSRDEQIKKRAERLVNMLGDRGFYDYGQLLSTVNSEK